MNIRRWFENVESFWGVKLNGRKILALNPDKDLLQFLLRRKARQIGVVSKNGDEQLRDKGIFYLEAGMPIPSYNLLVLRMSGDNHNMLFEGYIDAPPDCNCKHEGKCEHKRKRAIPSTLWDGKQAIVIIESEVPEQETAQICEMLSNEGFERRRNWTSCITYRKGLADGRA